MLMLCEKNIFYNNEDEDDLQHLRNISYRLHLLQSYNTAVLPSVLCLIFITFHDGRSSLKIETLPNI